ncbi:LysM peptidoglycan-binding domain-containing protein [Brevibacillus choshinensis]|uniref:CgeB family protein n=1 Tax=Brevibacillus choshinensis TaxID=54911 RepID=UPI002E1A4AB5|nr:LysM peptidoglycan-binding domain-containing protein [Brevibacillus choshinensis]
MRVLFLESHPMWIHGLPNGFRDAGHEVKVSGPLTEENIPKMIAEFRPHLIVMMGWGPEHTFQRQNWIQKYVHATDIPLVYWATEDPTFAVTFSLPLIRMVMPHFVFTISPSWVKHYNSLGIKAAHMDFGYHSSVHHPVESLARYRSTISVVANAYPHVFEKYPDHYRLTSLHTLIRPLLQEQIRINFFGRDWDKMKPYLGVDIPREWQYGYLPYTDANKVYSSSDIIIGLQNYKNQVTQRTYEILGSGGFLFTLDTPEIRRLFTPGKDLVASSSPEETLRLIRHYLDHPEECKPICEQGRLAVSNASYRHRAEYMITVLQEGGILTMEDRLELNGENNDEKEKPVIHRVKKGDTLWEIAKQYGVTVEKIKSWNKLTSDMIYVDDCLTVSDVPEEAQDHSDGPKESTHLVKRGDTLWNISKMYGVSVEQLKIWNNLVSDTINENQLLKIEDDETERT